MSELTPQKYLSTADAAKIADCTPGYIAKLCRQGYLPGTRSGSSWLVSETDLSSYLSSVEKERTIKREALARVREQEYRTHQPLARRQLSSIKSFARSHAATLLLVVVAGSLFASANFSGHGASLAGRASVPSEVASGSVSHTVGEATSGSPSGERLVASVLDSLSESNVPFASNIASFFGRVLAFFTGGETSRLAVVPVSFPPAQPDVVVVSVPAVENKSEAIVVSGNPQAIVQNIYPTTYVTNAGISKSYVDIELARLSNIFNRSLDNIPSRASRTIGPVVGTSVSADSLSLTGAASIDSLTLANALTVLNGGTGSTTLSGILAGNGTSAMKSALIGTGLSWDGTTLTAISGTVAAGTAGQFPYYAADGSVITATSSIFLAASGNVGIGTTSPSENLEIGGLGRIKLSGTAPRIYTGSDTSSLKMYGGTNSQTGAGIEYYGDNAAGTYGALTSAGSLLLRSKGTGSIIFGHASAGSLTGDGPQIIVSSTGSLSLGSTTPWGLLAVNPNALGTNVPEFVIGSSSATHFIVDGGGRVGIGTASPSTPLHVLSVSGPQITAEGTGATNYAMLALKGSAREYRIGVGGASESVVGVPNKFFIYDVNGAATRLTIDTSGNVGIGTTTPDTKLTISAGNVSFDNGYGILIKRASDNSAINVLSIPVGTNNLQLRIPGSNTEALNVLNSGGTNNFTIQGNGNVGIGTTTPVTTGSKVLNLYSSTGSSEIRLQNSTTGSTNSTGLQIYSVGTASYLYNYDNTPLIFGTNGSERVRILSGGNVGVGTTTPAQALDLVGNIHAEGSSATLFLNRYGSSGNSNYVDFTGSRAQIGYNGATSNIAIQGGTGKGIEFNVNNTFGSGQAAVITSAGNVGIGTTSPEKLVHLYQAGVGATSLKIEGSANATDYTAANVLLQSNVISNFRGLGTYYFDLPASNEWYSGRPYSTSDMFAIGRQTGVTKATSAGSSAQLVNALFVINSSGNVGVGTTSPYAKLSIKGAGTGTGRNLQVTDSADVPILTVIDSGHVVIGKNGTYTLANGPYVPLVVDGGTAALPSSSGKVTNGTAAFNSAGEALVIGGIDSSPFGSWIQSQNMTTSSQYRNLSLNPSGGNVGIGSTSPYAKLSVKGAGTTSGVNFQTTNSSNTPLLTVLDSGNIGIGSSSPESPLTVVSSQATGMTFYRNSSNNSALEFRNTVGSMFVGISGTGDFGINRTSGFASANSPYLTVLNSSGNVGIGTTTPGAKLDVFGNVNIGTGVANSVLAFNDANSSNYYRTITDTGSGLQISNSEQGGTVLSLVGISGATDYFTTTNIDVINFNSGQFYLQQSTGNVGIGTTTPSAALEVIGQASDFQQALSIRSAAAGQRILMGVGSTGERFIESRTNGGTASDLVFNRAGGNIGIGTTTPLSTLTTVRSGGGAYLPTSGTTPTGSIFSLRNSSVNNVLHMGLAGATPFGAWLQVSDAANLATNYPLALNPNGGNIGIGTTSPSVLLTVGASNTGTGLDANEVFQFGGGSSMYGTLRNGTDKAYLGLVSTEGFIGTQTSLPFALRTGGNDRVTITAAGNVGIGTTTPLSALNVYGTTGITWNSSGFSSGLVTIGTGGNTGGSLFVNTASFNDSTGNNSGFGVSGTYDNTAKKSVINLSGYGVKASTYSSDIAFSTTNSTTLTEVLRLTSGGNVGIGTSTPTANLHVVGYEQLDGGSAQLRLFPSGDSTYIGTANAYKLNFRTGALDRMTIDVSGNVGIGTTSPNSKLTIMGTIAAGTDSTADGYYMLRNSITPADRQVAYGVASYNTLAESNGIFAPIVQGRNNNLGKFAYYFGYAGLYASTTPTASADSVLLSGTNAPLIMGINFTSNATYFSAGNVGIGTTTPGAPLNVTIGSASDVLRLERTNQRTYGFNLSGNMLNITDRGSDGTGSAVLFSLVNSIGSNGTIGALGIGSSTPWAKLGVKGNGTTSGVNFQTTDSSNAPLFTILDSGNVGVGTTNPSAPLVVKGNSSGDAFYVLNNAGTVNTDLGLDAASGNARLRMRNSAGTISVLLSANAGVSSYINAGNVGIGTTSPSSLLHLFAATRPTLTIETSGVLPKGRIFQADNNAGGRLDLSSNLSFDGTNYNRDDTSQKSALLSIIGGEFNFRVAAAGSNPATLTNVFYITNGGNVGVGTTSPMSLFAVAGKGTFGDGAATTPQLEVIGGTGGTGMIRLNRSGTGSIYDWALTGGGLAFNDVSGASGATIVNIFGNAGSNDLYVGQNGKTVSDTRPSLLSGTTFSSSAGSDVAGQNFTIRSGLGTGAGTPGDLIFQTGTALGSGSTAQSGSARLTVKATTGNVGIGTTTPTYGLVAAQGDGNNTIVQVAGVGANFSGIILSNYSTNQQWRLANWGTSAGAGALSGKFGIYNGNTSTNALVIDASNNVGIGTTTPTARFSVTGTGTGTGRLFTLADSSNVERFTVLDGGSVGIGITNPSSSNALTVNGNFYATGISTMLTTAGGQTASNALNNFNNNAGLLVRKTGAGTGDYLAIEDSSSNTLFTVKSSGNVGIGTTSPDALLTLNSGATATIARFSNNNGSIFFNGTSGTLNEIVSRNLANTAYSDFAIRSQAGAQFTVATNGTVGIGTSTPAFPLDVYSTVSSNQTYGYVNSAGLTGTSAGTNSYSIRAQGRVLAQEFNAVSDRRLKDVQFELGSAVSLDLITRLQPVSFTWKNNPGGQPVLGFIAQDVEAVIPNAVSRLATQNFPDQRSLDYGQVISVSVGAIKELNNRTITLGAYASTTGRTVEDLGLALDMIASTTNATTSSSTPGSVRFATSFWKNVFAKVSEWIGDSTNGIKTIVAGQLRAKETICVDDQCLSKDDVRVLLQMAHERGSAAVEASVSTPPPASAPITDTPTLAPVPAPQSAQTTEPVVTAPVNPASEPITASPVTVETPTPTIAAPAI